MKISIFVTLMFLSVLLFSNFSSGAEAIKIDFEDGKTDGWEFIDDETAKPKGPSKWEIRDGKLDGKSLYQGSNIWGNKPPSKGTGKEDSCLLGTYAIYQGRDFKISLWKWMFSPLTTTAWVLYGGLQVKINTIESS